MPTITDVLDQYITAIDSGFGLIQGDVAWLFNVLVILNVVFAALIWTFSEDQVIAQLARKVIYIGFFAWIVQNWHLLTSVLAQTFLQLGLKAGGGSIPEDIMLNPGAIAGESLTVTAPIQQYIRSLSGPIETMNNFFPILILGFAVIAIIISYFVIAVQAIIAILAFKLGTLIAFILIPFSLLKQSSFMAERPLGWVVGSAVRLMALTLVVGIGQSVLGKVQLDPNDMTIGQALDVTFGALVLMILSLTATRLASELVTGSPRLGATDVALAVGGAGAASTLVMRNAASAASQISSKVRSTGSTLVHAAARMQGDKPDSPTPAPGSTAPGVVPGVSTPSTVDSASRNTTVTKDQPPRGD